MRGLLYCILAGTGVFIIFLFAAQSVSLIVDRFYTVLVESPHLDLFRYNNGVLELGGKVLYTMNPDFVWCCTFAISTDGRVAIKSGESLFEFGPGQSVPSRTGQPEFEFSPDPGDVVSLTVERSALSWPTPFEMNFMTGVAASWRRHVYCRLGWRKRSGAKLEMLWRLVQSYYREGGWSPAGLRSSRTA